MHRFQNPVRTRLEREMNVLGDFRQIGERLDQIVAKSDRMRRGKTKPLQTIDLVHGFEQLDEGALAVRPSGTRAGQRGSRFGRAASLP